MPIQRRQGESKDEFISRCIPIEIKSGKSQEQSTAICYSYWEEKQLSAVKRIRKKNYHEQIIRKIDVYGYKPRHFDMCPGAVATFTHLVEMNLDDETRGMVRSAAQIADNVFKIEKEVIAAKSTDLEHLNEVVLLVDDFKDLMNEIDEITGMIHDVSYMDGHIQTIKEYLPSEMLFESYSDYPEAAKENAKIALRWADENGWGSCGTPVGKQRANQLANGENISEETISRMAGFERHRQNSQKELGDGCGRLMWLAWGGDEGIAWAQRKLEQIRNQKLSHFEKVRVGVQSSNVDKMMWNSETLELVIRFNDGSTYTYVGVDEKTFNDISEGDAKPITSGENEYGSWQKGVKPSVGAAVHQYLIKKGVGFNPGGTFR